MKFTKKGVQDFQSNDGPHVSRKGIVHVGRSFDGIEQRLHDGGVKQGIRDVVHDDEASQEIDGFILIVRNGLNQFDHGKSSFQP